MLRTIAHIGIGTAVIFLLAVGITLLVLKQTGSRALSVQSGSMAPAIHQGDLVIVSKAQEYKVGDIVTFTNPADERTTITHRVVEVQHDGRVLQTKGDANRTADKPVGVGSVAGKATYRLPYLGHAIDALRHPLGLVIIIYVPALLIVGSELRRLTAYYRQQTIRQRRQSVRERRMVSVLRTSAVAVLLVPLALSEPVYAALQSSAALTGNTIRSVTVPQQYEVCLFPEWRNLLSYAPGDALYPLPETLPLALEQPILPGTYQISAVSTDDHTAHLNEPAQPNERWFLQLYTDNLDQPAYQTGVTDDLPSDADTITTTVNQSIAFDDIVTNIRYAHAMWPNTLEIDQFGGRPFDALTEVEKRSVLWNSVHPGCVTFVRQPPSEQL